MRRLEFATIKSAGPFSFKRFSKVLRLTKRAVSEGNTEIFAGKIPEARNVEIMVKVI